MRCTHRGNKLQVCRLLDNGLITDDTGDDLLREVNLGSHLHQIGSVALNGGGILECQVQHTCGQRSALQLLHLRTLAKDAGKVREGDRRSKGVPATRLQRTLQNERSLLASLGSEYVQVLSFSILLVKHHADDHVRCLVTLSIGDGITGIVPTTGRLYLCILRLYDGVGAGDVEIGVAAPFDCPCISAVERPSA